MKHPGMTKLCGAREVRTRQKTGWQITTAMLLYGKSEQRCCETRSGAGGPSPGRVAPTDANHEKGTDMTTQKQPDLSQAPVQTPGQGDGQKGAKQPDPGLSARPDDNVDQDGHCITPAYGEAVGPNSGAPCDDGRDGGK